MKKNFDMGVLVLRLSLGILLILHGYAKIQKGTGPIEGLLEKNGLPGMLAYLVFVGEIIAPLMLIFGYRTKIGALLVMATMLVAVFLTALGKVASLTETGAWALELPALFFTGSLALLLMGGGKYAISHKNKWD